MLTYNEEIFAKSVTNSLSQIFNGIVLNVSVDNLALWISNSIILNSLSCTYFNAHIFSLKNSFPLFLNHLLTKLFECFASLCWIFRVCLSSDFYNFKFLIFCIIGYMATWPHTFVMLGGQPWVFGFLESFS